ncbi:TetR family transcriptional regulator [Leifsonia poae]|uniref:TetR family transcriptional regulator n=1 Tax=Leifsonia poae TaxID=110933 RepID=UPI003D675B54
MTTTTGFQRARSTDAKLQREAAILDAARALGLANGIRRVTLTDIAEAVGMHKSALLRYFETREQIFLRLTAASWREWSPAVCETLEGLDDRSPASVARVIASSLTSRPLFCDLLAQTPLNLERNVSVEGVRTFKLTSIEEFGRIVEVLTRVVPVSEDDAADFMAAAVALAGALYQIATPGPELEELYRSDPRLMHSVLDLEPRLTRMLAAMLRGFAAPAAPAAP